MAGLIVFMRSPGTNYVFDEQEALLANPYVNGEVGWLDVLNRDFWGLPAERTIGSYRPIPNLFWRPLHWIHATSWLPHLLNVVFHTLNAALLAHWSWKVTAERRIGWLVGSCFLLCAVLTEAICGVVGLADILCGTGVLLALQALQMRWLWVFPGVFAGMVVGFFSKESVLAALPILPWAAFLITLSSRVEPTGFGRRTLRAMLASLGGVGALIVYTYTRRTFFQVKPGKWRAESGLDSGAIQTIVDAFLDWFRQPISSPDPVNNPLALVHGALRLAGALRIYFRGLVQTVFPWTLSGDYSAVQEPVPLQPVFAESVLGAACIVLPVCAGITCGWLALRCLTERKQMSGELTGTLEDGVRSPDPRIARANRFALLAIGLVWVPIAYFPHSNIVVLLPTIRAERLWYLPALGVALCVGTLLSWWFQNRSPKARQLAFGFCGAFFTFQAVQARAHANDYANDLKFWAATRRAAPYSAKAQLNYGVMLGARGRLDKRLEAGARAIELVPTWARAQVYHGDTLCRLKRAHHALPFYLEGFHLEPNEKSLIALGLQCLWDKKAAEAAKLELTELAREHPGTWLAHLVRDLYAHGEENAGVAKKHRPRGYNQGPKKR